MKKNDRLCNRQCIKDGEAHEFDGPVKVVLIDELEHEERWRILGAAFVGMANMMMAANLAIIFLYALSYKENAIYSAHCMFCTVGAQLCIPLSILVLHSMHGPSALMTRSQRRKEHILFSLLGMVLAGPAAALPFMDPRECTPTIHIYGAYGTGIAAVISVVTGLLVNFMKAEQTRPTFVSSVHRFWGMLVLLGSSFTYLTSIGGCRATMQFWLYCIGREAPLYMIYFIVIFYNLVVLTIPGSKFLIYTKYNYDHACLCV